MDFKQSIRSSLEAADVIVQALLADITPQELLLRPAPDANHIAWQLGHLIRAEHALVELAAPGTMPALPTGFKERHTNETAKSDDPATFLAKEEYLRLAKEIRAGTLQVLAKVNDADMDRPVGGPKLPPFIKRAGDAFITIGPHWIGHAGQWTVLRRKLGRPRLF